MFGGEGEAGSWTLTLEVQGFVRTLQGSKMPSPPCPQMYEASQVAVPLASPLLLLLTSPLLLLSTSLLLLLPTSRLLLPTSSFLLLSTILLFLPVSPRPLLFSLLPPASEQRQCPLPGPETSSCAQNPLKALVALKQTLLARRKSPRKLPGLAGRRRKKRKTRRKPWDDEENLAPGLDGKGRRGCLCGADVLAVAGGVLWEHLSTALSAALLVFWSLLRIALLVHHECPMKLQGT